MATFLLMRQAEREGEIEMGNRAVITTKEREIGLYLHWNGGRDTVEPLLRYCELQGYRPPSQDCYGWARMCQVMGNFFGGSLSLGIDRYTNDKAMNPGDNGIYVIEGWQIVDRITYEGFTEQHIYDFNEMLKAFDEAMPESERLGDLLDAVWVPTSEIAEGDRVFLSTYKGWELCTVIGFDKDGVPYVDYIDHDGDYSWNPNNYLNGDMVPMVPKGL